MSAARNFQTSPRTAYVDLVCGEQSVRLTVTQTGLSDDTNFSTLFDETFAQALQKQNIVADAEQITLQEIQSMAAMTSLDISESESNPGALTSLQGIEYFEALTSLWCQYNQLPSLGVSNNKELTKLYCQSNSLTSLDISQNTKLTSLLCHDNPGDGESKFPVTVWGDNATKPESLYIPYTSWKYNGKIITIDYRTATAE